MKKLLALMLCAGLLVGTVAVGCTDASAESGSLAVQTPAGTGEGVAQAGQGTDWARDAFDRLHTVGIIAAGVNYEYMANLQMPRGLFAGFLTQCVQKTAAEDKLAAVQPVAAGHFFDGNMTKDQTYAVAYGIMEGQTVGGVRYGDLSGALTREQAAKMVCSALDFFTGLGYTAEPSGSAATYTDAASVSAWAAPYTGRIAAYQIMVGDQNGRFDPQGALSGASAVVMLDRVHTLMGNAGIGSAGGAHLESKLDWSQAAKLGTGSNSISKPLTGYAPGYYTVDNGDGTLTGVTVPRGDTKEFFVERYDAAGKVAKSWTLPIELPIFGGFYAGKDHYYVAFGQADPEETGKEAYRVVQYDKDWKRVAAASVTSKEGYTSEPYRSTVSRMDESADGKTLVLYAARQRYRNDKGEVHQSNITIQMNTKDMTVKSVSAVFPENHVSHSFGQFVRFDGSKLVYADHGDAYPRSFVLQTESGGSSSEATLMDIGGKVGDNVTNAIGSGLEVSDSSYLFLGCSVDQSKLEGPWNVFLATVSKGSSKADFKWLTQSAEESIDAARLVKVDDDTFVALWGQSDGVHYQRLDGKGAAQGDAGVLEGALMPPTQPVVQNGAIRWIQFSGTAPAVYTLELDA